MNPIHRTLCAAVLTFLPSLLDAQTIPPTRPTPEQLAFMDMENIANGQKIARYTLEAMVAGKWQALVPANEFRVAKPYNPSPGYETIGHKKIDRVRPVTTDRMRFRYLDSVAPPAELRSLAVFDCPPLAK